MYQFYYADEKKKIRQVRYQKDMRNGMEIPGMTNPSGKRCFMKRIG